MLDEGSSKEAIQQIDQMAIDQPNEPILIKNVVTPTPQKFIGVLMSVKNACFKHSILLHFRLSYYIS